MKDYCSFDARSYFCLVCLVPLLRLALTMRGKQLGIWVCLHSLEIGDYRDDRQWPFALWRIHLGIY